MCCTWPKTHTLATARCANVLLPFFRFLRQVYRGWWWSGPTAASRHPTAGPRSAFTRGTSSNSCSPTCTAPGGRCVSLPFPRVSTRHLPALGEKTCHGGVVGVRCHCSIISVDRRCVFFLLIEQKEKTSSQKRAITFVSQGRQVWRAAV